MNGRLPAVDTGRAEPGSPAGYTSADEGPIGCGCCPTLGQGLEGAIMALGTFATFGSGPPGRPTGCRGDPCGIVSLFG